MAGPERRVEGICARKAAGADCTAEESAELLRYFDRHAPDADGFEVAALFPGEAEQWKGELAAGWRDTGCDCEDAACRGPLVQDGNGDGRLVPRPHYECGSCGRRWSTPTPAARCLFEYDHHPEDDDES